MLYHYLRQQCILYFYQHFRRYIFPIHTIISNSITYCITNNSASYLLYVNIFNISCISMHLPKRLSICSQFSYSLMGHHKGSRIIPNHLLYGMYVLQLLLHQAICNPSRTFIQELSCIGFIYQNTISFVTGE